MAIYLKIDTIDGQSTHHPYVRWMDAYSFNWGLVNTGSILGGGAGSGKSVFEAFSLVKPSEKGSPRIMLACAKGTRFNEVKVFVTLNLDNQELVYQEYYLTDCMITSHQVGGDASTVPSESIAFDFRRIRFVQYVYDEFGQLLEVQENYFDRRTNTGG